jgi:CII-binding regulator of phage lambda lysogenization HflD
LPHLKLVARDSSNDSDIVQSLNGSLQNMTQEELYRHYLNCQKLLSQNGSLQCIQSYNSLIEAQMGPSFPSLQHYEMVLLQLKHEVDKDQQHLAWFQQILQNLYQVVQHNLHHNPQTQQQLFFTAQQLGLQTIDPN